jgi:hypothetical protein
METPVPTSIPFLLGTFSNEFIVKFEFVGKGVRMNSYALTYMTLPSKGKSTDLVQRKNPQEAVGVALYLCDSIQFDLLIALHGNKKKQETKHNIGD